MITHKRQKVIWCNTLLMKCVITRIEAEVTQNNTHDAKGMIIQNR